MKRCAGIRDALVKLYQEHGFFDSKVKYSVRRNFKTRKVTVTYTIEENQPSSVRNIKLVFKDPAEEQEWAKELESKIVSKAGQTFSLAQYQETKSSLSRTLSNKAHPLHRILGQVLAYPEQKAVDLVFLVEAGPVVIFGPLRIMGNKRVAESLIRRELTFKEGQPFSLDALENSERALLKQGFFTAVSFEPQYREADGEAVPLHLVVEERSPHSIRFGLGYGTEDRLRLRISQVNRNFLGLGDSLTFEGKLSSIYQGLMANWTLPYFPTDQTRFSLEGGRDQRENEAYTSRSWIGRPGIESRYSGPWSWSLSYNIENTKVTDLKAKVPDPEVQLQNFFISSIPASIRYDSRDSILNPTKGLMIELQNELSLGAFGSDLNFMRPVGEISFVLPFFNVERVWFATRLRGGLVFDLATDDNVPLIRRFFPGGADSVRGYPFQLLGPLDSSGNPLGGEIFAVSNFELRFPMEPVKELKGLGGVLFIDAGNAWLDFDSRDGDFMRYTSGFGLRYDTPLGPIRADIGYQLNPPDNADFGRWQAYLSVGQAF